MQPHSCQQTACYPRLRLPARPPFSLWAPKRPHISAHALQHDKHEAAGKLRFAVIGGGLAGVATAYELLVRALLLLLLLLPLLLLLLVLLVLFQLRCSVAALSTSALFQALMRTVVEAPHRGRRLSSTTLPRPNHTSLRTSAAPSLWAKIWNS